jgi:hypothetical protein
VSLWPGEALAETGPGHVLVADERKDVDARVKPGHDEDGECDMRNITLDSQTDFDGWRKAARAGAE